MSRSFVSRAAALAGAVFVLAADGPASADVVAVDKLPVLPALPAAPSTIPAADLPAVIPAGATGGARLVARAGGVGGLGLEIAGIEFGNRDAVDHGEDAVGLERDLQGVPLRAS